jgi:hypothetical protein
MKRLTLGAVLVCAALSMVLSAVVTASASAANLPEFSVETNFSATFGKSKLNTSGAEIKSTKGGFTNSVVINKRLGTGTIQFEGSTLGGEECRSEGNAAGTSLISVPVEWHLVPTPTQQDFFIVFLVKETKIKCKFLSTTVVVENGSTIIGKIAATSKTKFTLAVNVVSGKQEFTKYENDAGEAVETALKLKVDGISAKGTQEDEAATITTEKETELLTS